MATAPCFFCDQETTLGQLGEWRLVEGLAANREGGGAHGLSLMKELHKYAHNHCMDLRLANREQYMRRHHGVFNCQFCGTEATGVQMGAAVLTRGWVQEREGGGVHGISLRRDRETGACPGCMEKILSGNNPNQESLL